VHQHRGLTRADRPSPGKDRPQVGWGQKEEAGESEAVGDARQVQVHSATEASFDLILRRTTLATLGVRRFQNGSEEV